MNVEFFWLFWENKFMNYSSFGVKNSPFILKFSIFVLPELLHLILEAFCFWVIWRSTCHPWGTRWRSWLRHCATSRKVAGSIPDAVTGIFHWHNPSGRTEALGSTQPLTEMSTRNICWGVKAAGVYGWQPYHLHVLIVLKSGSLSLLEPWGPVQACNGIALPYLSSLIISSFKKSHYFNSLATRYEEISFFPLAGHFFREFGVDFLQVQISV